MSLCVKVEIDGNSVIKVPRHSVRLQKVECHLMKDEVGLIEKYLIAVAMEWRCLLTPLWDRLSHRVDKGRTKLG